MGFPRQLFLSNHPLGPMGPHFPRGANPPVCQPPGPKGGDPCEIAKERALIRTQPPGAQMGEKIRPFEPREKTVESPTRGSQMGS